MVISRFPAIKFCIPILLSLLFAGNAKAEQLTIAVAANFKSTITLLAERYQELNPKVEFRFSIASTGILYAQIVSGAPYDLFFAADSERPQLLVRDGQALPASLTSYALGKLVVYAPLLDLQRPEDLLSYKGRLAVANPRTAPYGQAAIEFLSTLDEGRNWSLVYGNNIIQTYQYVSSGNVQAGIIAASQLTPLDLKNVLLVPKDSYSPIRQQAVVLKGTNATSAGLFLQFVTSFEGRSLIEAQGYLTEPGKHHGRS